MYAPLPQTVVPPGPPAGLPGAVVALIGVAAVVVVAVPFLWPAAEHLGVMAHEGAHALVGAVLGQELAGVEVNRNTGVTWFWVFASSRWRASNVVTAFVGYLGPSAFGLGAAKLIETGRLVAVLWLAVVFLVLLLLATRRSLGIATIPAAIAVLVLVARDGHAALEQVVVYGLTWILLLTGLRVAVEHGIYAADASRLRDITRVPRRVWALLWLAGTLLAVVIGGKWMILRT